MKLISVEIKNFRLLKHIKIEFSTNPKKNLTVIRAANASGKTSLLNALQWALYGNTGLPNNGKDFRKSPNRENLDQNIEFCEIKAEIYYETISPSGTTQYKITRTSTEKVDGTNFTEHLKSVSLFHKSDKGYVEEEYPDAKINFDLPKDLREVFFTDGDAALNFIQGEKEKAGERVEGAIRALLGLNIYEKAIVHTKHVISKIEKSIKEGFAGDEKINQYNEIIKNFEDHKGPNLIKHTKAKHGLERSIELLKKTEQNIDAALKNGNREELAIELKQVIEEKDNAILDVTNTNKGISDLFKEEILAKHLLRKKFDVAGILLEELHEQGHIPSQTVPVLKERLITGSCICGESLDEKDQQSIDRRNRIEQLIKDSKNPDKTKENLSALYFTSQNLLEKIESEDENWPKIFKKFYKERDKFNSTAELKGKRQTELRNTIDTIPDVDIRQLNEERSKFMQDRDTNQSQEIESRVALKELDDNIKDYKADRDILLRNNNLGKQYYSELTVAKDLQNLFEISLKTMKTTELVKVSDLMNNLFLEMIGAGRVEQKANITSAKIDQNYKIIVYGTLEQKLDTEFGLNGASKRALTIAFILALTQISGTEAPNVIDTPLGMMSGYVKQSTLKIAIHQSTQLILFLTHSEIKDCEEIIEQSAGKHYTFTNPASFPTIIKNKPDVEDSGILVCECLLDSCHQCELSKSAQTAISKDKSLIDWFGWGKK